MTISTIKSFVNGVTIDTIKEDFRGCTHYLDDDKQFFEIKAIVYDSVHDIDVVYIIPSTKMLGIDDL